MLRLIALAACLLTLSACGRAARVSLVVPPDQAARVHIDGDRPRVRIETDSPIAITTRLESRGAPAEELHVSYLARTLPGPTIIRFDNDSDETGRVDVHVTDYRELTVDGAKPRDQLETEAP